MERWALGNIGRLCFAGATQIVDFYHALEHAGKVLVALLGSKDHPDYKPRLAQWARRLLKDQVEKLIAESRKQCAGKAPADAVEKELGYFVSNIERMQYGTFRRRGLFVGSGGRRSRMQDGERSPLQAIRYVLGQRGR